MTKRKVPWVGGLVFHDLDPNLDEVCGPPDPHLRPDRRHLALKGPVSFKLGSMADKSNLKDWVLEAVESQGGRHTSWL